MIKNTQNIASLTPLRGIAALWVVVYHYDEFLSFMGFGHLIDRDISLIIGKSYLFVDFFFLLSGFVICHVYGDSLTRPTKGSTATYLWARFIRLYPLHVFAMFALLFQFLWLKSAYPELTDSWAVWYPSYDFFVYLLFGQSSGILSEYTWNLPSWSIAAEWWTYILAVGFLPFLHRGFSKYTVLTWVLASGVLSALIMFGGKGNLDYTINFGTLRCLCSFIIGVGIYQAYLSLHNTTSAFGKDWACFVSVVTTLLALTYGVNDVLIVLLFGAILITASLNVGRVKKALNVKPLMFLGDISYSIYMMQIFWLTAWNMWVDIVYKPSHVDILPTLSTKILWLVLTVAMLIVSSYLTYRYIELPAKRFLRRRFDRSGASVSTQ